jgi:microsomal dipeptidase-like Zn-dependent dipeptidase
MKLAPRRIVKWVLVIFALVVVASVLLFFLAAPVYVDRSVNRTLNPPPYAAGERARALHQKLLIADLHADSLVWNRDLLTKGTRGHIDIPRLIEGNVALQVFTTVTKAPRGLNIERNDDSTDNIFWLMLAQRIPWSKLGSLKERALFEGRRLDQAAAASNGRLTVIRTQRDLARYLERRRVEPNITAGILGIEGAHALDGDSANVDALFAAGFRVMSPTHFFDNDFGGSAHGINKGGLTPKGREMIRRMESRRMVIDLAHASAATITDVLAMATRPVIVSHTGVKATCDNTRNLSDDQLRAVARNGGLIGIGFWDTAVCGTDAAAIARAIRHTVEVVGVDHVGLGSDFDGAVVTPFDVSGLVQLTEALINEGFSDQDIAAIMGGNEIRFWAQNLPE